MNKNQQADILEYAIKHLDTLYEEGQDCLLPVDIDPWVLKKFGLKLGEPVPDPRYDAIRQALKELRPDSEIFDSATASNLETAVKKVKHDPPMTSIEKASHEDLEKKTDMLLRWIERVGNPTAKDLYQQYKLDGVALALYYEDGKLVEAGLRPRDGINGEDVTQQAAYVKGVPQKLKKPFTCSIRGELICRLSDFEKVQEELKAAGEKLRANPRNHAAGGIRHFKEPKKVKKMRLSFIAYGIENLDDPPYETEIERAIWANKKLGITFVQTQPFDFDDLQKMEDNVPNLDYEVDGVVVGINNLKHQESWGRHGDKPTGNPRGKVAWKFAEQTEPAIIKEIEWNTGRTGAVKPVAIFDPIRLAGTNVSRATLHNIGFMDRNKIGIGTTIEVQKAGKIIPKVVGVVAGKKAAKGPSNCPSCGEKVSIVENNDKAELVCHNEDCPAQQLSTFCHHLKLMDILGLGEATVSLLIQDGKVKDRADFYALSIDDCVSCGLTNRESLLAVAGIHRIPNPEKMEDKALLKACNKALKQKNKIAMWKFFASLGIPTAGKEVGKILSDCFGSFDAIRKATPENFEQLDGIGTKTANIVCDYLDKHSQEIDKLLGFFEFETIKQGKLSGFIFCLSGSLDQGKKHWQEQIENLGGKCTGSVSKKVNFLVAGSGSVGKTEKAQKLGVKIIDIDELKKLL